MMLPAASLLTALFLSAGPFTSTSGPASASGTCNVANTGSIQTLTITCPGIPPAALQPLIKQLRSTSQSLAEARQQTEHWRSEYEDLQRQLAVIGMGTQIVGEVETLIKQGDLETATLLLHKQLTDETSQIRHVAEQHFLLASIYALQFKWHDSQLEMKEAYTLQPSDASYPLKYGDALLQDGQPRQAIEILEPLFSSNSARLGSDAKFILPYSLGMAHLLLKEDPATIRYMDVALKALPSVSPRISGDDRIEIVACITYKVEALEGEGNTQEARKQLAEALSIVVPSTPYTIYETAYAFSIMNTLVTELRSEGMWQQATVIFNNEQAFLGNPLNGQDYKIAYLEFLDNFERLSLINGKPGDVLRASRETIARAGELSSSDSNSKRYLAEGLYFEGQALFLQQNYSECKTAFVKAAATYKSFGQTSGVRAEIGY